MLLPNGDNAFVPRKKLTDYLLSESHAIGRAKARFFQSHGFTVEKVLLLRQGLLDIARNHEVREVIQTAYGTKYVIDGGMLSPHGTHVRLRTVWIIEHGARRPRFVTAYPVQP